MNLQELKIGEKMRLLRERTGLGIHAVARQVGVAVSTVSRIENGHLGMGPELVPAWAAAIRVHPDVLYWGWGFCPPDLRPLLENTETAREVRELLKG